MKNQIARTLYTCFALMITASAFAQDNSAPEPAKSTTESNKQLIGRLFTEVLNARNTAVIDELYAEDVVDHSAFPDQEPGRAGIHSAVSGFFEHFDSLHIVIDDVIAEGNKVVTRETWTVNDESLEQPLSGTVIHIFRVTDGRITDEWSRGWDWLE